jgi:hypothetical protein
MMQVLLNSDLQLISKCETLINFYYKLLIGLYIFGLDDECIEAGPMLALADDCEA